MKFHNKRNESVLIKQCLNNERQAQRMLFEKYRDGMYTVIYRILRNEDLACDALQEGFIEVFNNLESFRGISTVS